MPEPTSYATPPPGPEDPTAIYRRYEELMDMVRAALPDVQHELDEVVGQLLAEAEDSVLAHDTEAGLAQRVAAAEHELGRIRLVLTSIGTLAGEAKP